MTRLLDVPGVGPVLVVAHALERMRQRGIGAEDLRASLAGDPRKVRATLTLAEGLPRRRAIDVALGPLVVVLARRSGRAVVRTVWWRDSARAAA